MIIHRLGAATLLALVAMVPPSSAVDDGDQWKPIDQSMAELVGDGYELVTVVPAPGRHNTYFLRTRGKLAKCEEATTVDVSNMPPPPPRPPRGSAQPMPMADNVPMPGTRVTMECFELVRPEK